MMTLLAMRGVAILIRAYARHYIQGLPPKSLASPSTHFREKDHDCQGGGPYPCSNRTVESFVLYQVSLA